MKILLCILTTLVFSCKTSVIDNQATNDEIKSNLTSNCPNDGSCTFEIISNSSMQITSDETGALYPKFLKSESMVLKYEYKRNEQSNIADDGYSELIYLEIKKDDLELELKNFELKQVKLLFARLCFCRGETGYFEVTDGHLSIFKKNDIDYQIDLTFKTDKVPQLINHISETFVLK